MIQINKHSKTIQPCEEVMQFFASEGGKEFESFFWAGGDDVRYVMNALSQLSNEDLDEVHVALKERLMLSQTSGAI